MPVKSFAASEGPSDWAQEEITLANEKGFVPDYMTYHYQDDIKRYEFVVLALNLVDLKENEILIKDQHPFTDISGNMYEEEIVKAYNAGIIKGDGTGKFRPDDFITRQEIASLIVSLAKWIMSTDDLDMIGTYAYADKEDIDNWALGYINYCYNHQILTGVGKDKEGMDIIDPHGNTTIEQAVIMVYRLAKMTDLFTSYETDHVDVLDHVGYGIDDKVTQYETRATVKSEVVSELIDHIGKPLTDNLLSIAKELDADIVRLDDRYILISAEDEGKISISDNGLSIAINLQLQDPSNDELINGYVSLVESLSDSDNLSDLVTSSIEKMKDDQDFSDIVKISDEDKLSFEYTGSPGTKWYMFTYQYAKHGFVELDNVQAVDLTDAIKAYSGEGKKEIVIVTDVSSSMNDDLLGNSDPDKGDSKLDIAKKAQLDFIKDLEAFENVYVSLVSYDNTADVLFTDEQLLNVSVDTYQEFFENEVERLTAQDGSNIGDAIRRGKEILEKGDKEADKYIIVLTDGMPLGFSVDTATISVPNFSKTSVGILYKDQGYDSYYIANLWDVDYYRGSGYPDNYFANYGDNDFGNYSLNYAKAMASDLYSDVSGIKSYYIGMGTSADIDRLLSIANQSKGSCFEADTSSDLKNIYNMLLEDIISQ